MSRDAVVGTAESFVFDSGMGVVTGAFTPYAAYDTIREVFRRLSDGLDRRSTAADLFRERDELALALMTPSGERLATSWIMIYDFAPEVSDRELEAHLTDRDQVRRYFCDTGE